MKKVTSIGALNRSLAAVGEAVDRSSFGMVLNRSHYEEMDAINRVLFAIGEEVNLDSFRTQVDIEDERPDTELDAVNRVLEPIGEELGQDSLGTNLNLGYSGRYRDLRLANCARS